MARAVKVAVPTVTRAVTVAALVVDLAVGGILPIMARALTVAVPTVSRD
jgi:hypothetical protein